MFILKRCSRQGVFIFFQTVTYLDGALPLLCFYVTQIGSLGGSWLMSVLCCYCPRAASMQQLTDHVFAFSCQVLGL